MFRDNSYQSRIILPLIMIRHIIIKKINNKNNTQMTYTGLKPKSSQHNQVLLII